jgi:hypothetical protein
VSGFLAGKVWQSALEPHLKPLAAALADIANDDGTSIYPSVAYMAWLMGRSERSVRDTLRELRGMEPPVLIPVSGTRVVEGHIVPIGGSGRTTEYFLDESALPTRAPWRKGATVAPFDQKRVQNATEKGAVCDSERVQFATQRVKPTAEKGEAGFTRSVSDPSLEPPINTRQRSAGFVGEILREKISRRIQRRRHA